MIFTDRLTKALDTAAILHKDHTRIGKDRVPYITHLIHVFSTVNRYTDDEDTLIAALLHDTVEDVPEYTFDRLEDDFGIRVRNIVDSITEIRAFDQNLSPRDRWITAKKGYLQKLPLASTHAHLISAADKIHNMSTIITGYEQNDEKLMLRFDGLALKGQVWFTGEVLNILSGKIPSGLEEEYKGLHAKLQKLSEKYSN